MQPAENGMTHQVVHLKKDKVYPIDDKDVWVLDMGASNHVTSTVKHLLRWTHLSGARCTLEMGHSSRSRALVQ
jgi:hypothetical protein